MKKKECDLTIIASVNIILTPVVLKVYYLAKMISPTGRYHTFDSSVDIYLCGEGYVAVVLKSL